jgi:hypothetical protein
MDQMAVGVKVWWITLCVLAVFNVCVWGYSAIAFLRRRASSPGFYATRWPHVLLSAGYVLGCAFRSVLPRADVQRICLYDSWLSSVLVGRSVATVAELCFAAQWALMLRELSQAEENRFGVSLSRVVVPMIVVAETCSWYAVLTTSYIGNALEQSIWTLTAALLAAALFVPWRRATGTLSVFLAASMIACAGFVAFMCTVDVPMYLSRWYSDELQGRPYLSLIDGLRDVSLRWHVVHSWHEWQEEIAWMTLYFSLAVWISIALVHAPLPRKAAEAAARGLRGSDPHR